MVEPNDYKSKDPAKLSLHTAEKVKVMPDFATNA